MNKNTHRVVTLYLDSQNIINGGGCSRPRSLGRATREALDKSRPIPPSAAARVRLVCSASQLPRNCDMFSWIGKPLSEVEELIQAPAIPA